MMLEVASILFGALFTLACCLAAGRLVLARCGPVLAWPERVPLAFATGAAVWSLFIFVLAALNVVRGWVILVTGLLFIVRAARPLPNGRGSETSPSRERKRAVIVALAIVFAAFGAIYLVHAMAPEVSADGSGYHLGLVLRYLDHGGFYRITTSMYAWLSQGTEMLFLCAFAFGKHSAAALVHLAFLAALAWSMLAYARRIGRPEAGAVAAVLVVASPLAGVDASSAYIDVAAACVAFALFHLLEIWDSERTPALLVPIGLLAGFAYAVKYPAGVAVLYALGFVAWRLWVSRQALLVPLAVVALAAAAMIAPWMLKDWLWVDNPVAPFFNRLFPNPYMHVSTEDAYRAAMRHFNGASLDWQAPLDLTVRGGRFQGMLGVGFLAAPVALLALADSRGRRLLAAALVFAAAYPANIGARFLLVALPFVALAMGLAVARWKYLAVALLVVQAAGSWPWLLSKYCDKYAWRIQDFPWRAALRFEPEEAFLSARLAPTYQIARMIEARVPPGGAVYTALPLPEAYTHRTILLDYTAALNNNLSEALATPLTVDFQPIVHGVFLFTPERLKVIRVVQGAASSDLWSVHEIRVYDGNRRLEPAPAWRAIAQPNPWDARLAADGNPVTRWKSWQPAEPDQFVGIEFGQAVEADAVQLDRSVDQPHTKVRLEGQLEGGGWKTLAAEGVLSAIPAPAGMRRDAMDYFRASGVTHLLIHQDEKVARDIEQHAAQWRLVLIGTSGPGRLYRIE